MIKDKDVEIYLVGGAVRDMLLGCVPKDRDFVVVGADHEYMMYHGYRLVGKDFGVYLHPVTGEEYALARREQSTGMGTDAFDIDTRGVSIVQDLRRRDLTINAVAQNVKTREFVDPTGGMADIRNKVLRNISFAFKEDPVRVLRLARFKATLPGDWEFCPETVSMCRDMSHSGALDHITRERVWKEIEKSLKGHSPQEFFKFMDLVTNSMFPIYRKMKDTPQHPKHHPEGDVQIHTNMVMAFQAANGASSEEVFAGFCHDVGKHYCWTKFGTAHGHEKAGLIDIELFCNKFNVPKTYRKLALLVCEYHTKIHGVLGRGSNLGMGANKIMNLLEDVGAIRNFKVFKSILEVCRADACGRGGNPDPVSYQQYKYLMECWYAATDTPKMYPSAASLLDNGMCGIAVGKAVRDFRISQIREVKNRWVEAGLCA